MTVLTIGFLPLQPPDIKNRALKSCILTVLPSAYQSELARSGENRVSEQIIHVTDGDFEQQVLNAEGPVLVDYWAEWCGPCKMIAPIIEEIAQEYSGRLTVAKMDIDSNSMTPQQYSVRGIPTLMIFKDGNVQGTKVGAMTMGHLKAFVEETI